MWFYLGKIQLLLPIGFFKRCPCFHYNGAYSNAVYFILLSMRNILDFFARPSWRPSIYASVYIVISLYTSPNIRLNYHNTTQTYSYLVCIPSTPKHEPPFNEMSTIHVRVLKEYILCFQSLASEPIPSNPLRKHDIFFRTPLHWIHLRVFTIKISILQTIIQIYSTKVLD